MATHGRRQPGSAVSEVHSERILALGNHAHREPDTPLGPVDLSDAEAHEQQLADAIATVKDQLTELIKTCPMDPALRTEEQLHKIGVLKQALKQIEKHQAKLKDDMVAARQERRRALAEHKRAARVVHKPKAPPPVRMEELRALNIIRLDPEDAKARTEQAQKPRAIIPSGGFTNFRVAPDLRRMDFRDDDPNDPDKLEHWRPPQPKK